MSFQSHGFHRPGPSPTLGSWVLGCLLGALLIVVGACAPQAPAGDLAGAEPVAAQSSGDTAVSSEPSVSTEPAQRDGAGNNSASSTISTEDLVGAGEMGLLPSLFGSFGPSVECDSGDAFDSCQ